MTISKSAVAGRVDRSPESLPVENPLGLLEMLTVAFQMLWKEGHDSGLAGQLSCRAPDKETYWTLSFGTGFDEASPSRFIRVDDALVTVEGKGAANPATRFHLWIYRNRPEVNCVIHTHPPSITALSMLEEPIVVSHMDATPLYDDCAFLREWPGVPVADEEGRIISRALGSKRALLLAHHGLITACRTLEEATFLAITMERVARAQLAARAAGEIKTIPTELAKEAHDFILTPEIMAATFSYYARQVRRFAPFCLDDVDMSGRGGASGGSRE